MKNTRSTRESETRANEIMESYNINQTSALDVPTSVKKEGYSYAWVRSNLRGEMDGRVEEMAAKGWELVSADRAKNAALDPLDRNPLAKKFYCYKDLILMERPEEFSRRETEALNRFNENKIRSLRGVSNDIGSFASPTKSINSF
jgi:hypothetical protein